MLRRPSAPQWISKWQNIFGTFQIECEKFWTFWKNLIFHEKIMKIMKNHEKIMKIMKNHEKSRKSWNNRKFSNIFRKNLKNHEKSFFSKSSKIFVFYLESSKNVLRLWNPFGSARPTQHRPWKKRTIFVTPVREPPTGGFPIDLAREGYAVSRARAAGSRQK